MSFTVCALFYGDYPELAVRCLNKSMQAVMRVADETRIGLNEVSEQSRTIIQQRTKQAKQLTLIDGPNIYKYPMMRKLFHDTPLTTDYVLWLDDDSYLQNMDADAEAEAWLQQLEKSLQQYGIVGLPHRRTWNFRSSQTDWVTDQKWYTGQAAIGESGRTPFIPGSFWATHTKYLKCGDGWPTEDVLHFGGDVMLCELVRQQGGSVGRFDYKFRMNADGFGKHNGAQRRGDLKAPLVGIGYVSPRKAPKVE